MEGRKKEKERKKEGKALKYASNAIYPQL